MNELKWPMGERQIDMEVEGGVSYVFTTKEVEGGCFICSYDFMTQLTTEDIKWERQRLVC